MMAACRLGISLVIACFAQVTRADIYQWEYIHPLDPSLGKQQSTTLTPDGTGVNAVPNTNLNSRDLTKAYLIGKNLTNVTARKTGLADADMSGANLTNVDFYLANFSGAEIRRANFGDVRNFTMAQLASTASYQAQDLTGVRLSDNVLNGWNFAQQNLTNVSVADSYLNGADFSGAIITGTSFHHTTLLRGFTAAQLYSTASYQAKSLERINFGSNDLSNWNFAGQNLTDASFVLATLTNADLTGAEIRGANFYDTTATGFTANQLYSTASYQVGDLTGIDFRVNDLTGWNFAGQNLTDCDFSYATVADADFTSAIIHGVTASGFTRGQLVSTASYQQRSLTAVILDGSNLSDLSFAGHDLTGTSFSGAQLAGTDFTGAVVRNARFTSTTWYGFSPEQLYSTASYQSFDLTGLILSGNDLSGWNFEHQNMEGAVISSILAGTNFRYANLVRANFDSSGASASPDTDFTGADTRGSFIGFSDEMISTNMIKYDGTIAGLDLTVESYMLVRDQDDYVDAWDRHYPAVAITVAQELAMNSTSTLELRFDADEWNSTVSFEAGIPVALDGTLELTFADNVNVMSQVGRTLDLFDWTGVTPTGLFTVASDYEWDLTNLYTTGEVTLTGVTTLPGDIDGDGDVDGRDFLALQRDPSLGSLTAWQTNYGHSVSGMENVVAVPEPGGAVLVMAIAGVGTLRRVYRRQHRQITRG